ncbi:serine/threonine-protein phosphatase 2A 55 kDa regulatory subunit B alpha isoform isoform X1 [Ooceraea biroi]|uniref:serine/threonine-protein phosphatase 2A 55 kDa regulatory subunit B alpha isoform isoform X1 n=1 Tax=Ooceraea biroi TaxID=2015173 RepID=UPI0005BBD8E5|nr:serine/threonine-protein phosphatase 2A 55 kDa regulatory subunit B alpha isoform isoform X1 [Ooceraea biroi]
MLARPRYPSRDAILLVLVNEAPLMRSSKRVSHAPRPVRGGPPLRFMLRKTRLLGRIVGRLFGEVVSTWTDRQHGGEPFELPRIGDPAKMDRSELRGSRTFTPSRRNAPLFSSLEELHDKLTELLGNGDIQWCFSQVKGTLEDDVTEADIISCVEFNHDGDLLATGDKGGRVVIFQRDPVSKNSIPRRGEYNVYSTFQSHEPEFDYLKSLEIEEKINKIRWLKRKNPAHFLLSTNDKTIKLWKVSERDKRVEGYNTKEENGAIRDPACITALRVPTIKPMELMVEASPRRIFANAHTYHINSISVNSDQETYLSADDLRINLWHLEITDQSFNIVDIKPTNMEELTEVITAAEFHPAECNVLVYSSSKGTIRLCDMRSAALCDQHSKLFEEPEDPTNRSFFSEIISSISDVKLSNSGRYMISRDYLSVKVWDLQMETKPIECYPVHEYLRSKLCSLYENDCIFDKFECCWSGNDSAIMTGSYNNFFRVFDRTTKRDLTLEAARDIAKPKTLLKPRKVCTGGKRKKDEISVDCLDFNKKILHTAWHPSENVVAVAATNNLFLFQDKL